MNIAMEQTEEYVNGQLKNKYGDAFIRGNNGMSWSWISYYFPCFFPHFVWQFLVGHVSILTPLI
jgi:hypothetical protein